MMAGLISNYARLIRPQEMLMALEKQYIDPSYLFCSDNDETPPEDVWLFRLVCENVKAVGGMKQGYGYAQLVKDI
jgi:hypothetical protein